MTVMEDPGEDDFAKWVKANTGWDGQQFSLSEDERHWIKRADEIIEWLRLYAVTEDQGHKALYLDSALRSLNGLRPLPGSLTIE